MGYVNSLESVMDQQIAVCTPACSYDKVECKEEAWTGISIAETKIIMILKGYVFISYKIQVEWIHYDWLHLLHTTSQVQGRRKHFESGGGHQRRRALCRNSI